MDEELHHFAKPLPDGVIPCSTWDLETDPTRLPPLPALPQISTTGDETTPQETKIIKIAALDARIIALTNVGHVLLFSGVVDETAVLRGRWKYVRGLGVSYPEHMLMRVGYSFPISVRSNACEI
jgi:SCF-associated factor 1